MYLKLILSIFCINFLFGCDQGEDLLSQKWSENNAVKCTDKGNYILFQEQGLIYSNAVVEAMIFDKPRYIIDKQGDLLIYPYHTEQPQVSDILVNKNLYFKMIRTENRLSFDNFYLGDKVINNRLDEQLKNAVKLLDLVMCD